MRLKLSLAVIGLLLAGSAPALAQNEQNSNYYGSAAPTYAAPTGNYSTNGVVYNSGSVTPLPMQQMIAGKNAPSYNYGTAQPYNSGYSGNTSIGSLTPEQAAAQRAQRDAQAQAYQQQYMASIQQQSMQPNAATPNQQQGAFAQMYNNMTGGQEQQPPVKKRVVYNGRPSPLVEPPRLFKTD